MRQTGVLASRFNLAGAAFPARSPIASLFIAAAIAISVVGCAREGYSDGRRPRANRQAPGSTEAAEGAKVKKITVLFSENGGRVDWSQSTDLIVYSQTGDDGYDDVYTMSPDGSNQKCLTCNKAGVPQRNNGQPAWHPSGDTIVFQCQDPDLEVPRAFRSQEKYLTQGGAGLHNNLWITNKEGTEFHQLTHLKEREFILHPHFSHSGSKLLWSERSFEEGARRGAQWKLKVADFRFEAGKPRLDNIKSYRPRGTRETFYESHGFSPDDSAILFSANIGRSHQFDLDIWLMKLDSQELTQLTDTESVWDEHAHFSPDGKTIVWVSSQGYDFTPSNRWQMTLKTDFWLMNADGSGKRRLTYFNEPGHSEHDGKRTICADSAWNKSGTMLVASQAFGESKRIVVIELEK